MPATTDRPPPAHAFGHPDDASGRGAWWPGWPWQPCWPVGGSLVAEDGGFPVDVFVHDEQP